MRLRCYNIDITNREEIKMKKYPFSVAKNAHSVEYYYNHVRNIMYDVESGDVHMESAEYNKLYDFFNDELLPLYEEMFNSRDGRVVYLTGKQLGLAKMIVAWASEQRASSLIKAGKFEYLQYC